ncbi:hypothetical protein BV898_08675 [Hypsibius exemplaris]|uniref:C-type lectin domain-containing protein n=1 Tax=Hypsibius exemplaris TaxID=2072580 RepID=A0A1W0WQ52_HYPEX|nr:hypothetical protein BV898_08675 [Hypsibius exemplaris]
MKVHAYILIVLACSAVEARCPSACTCDLFNGQKRVHCDVPDSSQSAPLDNIDSDIEIIEVTPLRHGQGNAYGPALPAVFAAFNRLSKLVVQDNGVQTLPAATSRQLAHLVSLDLTGNDINALTDLSLSPFRELTVLTLAENKLQTVSAGDGLQYLTVLQSLNLADNQIRTIQSNAFRSQTMLRVLDLRNNQLRQLPNDFFDTIKRVERLDLRGNQLLLLPRGLLRMINLRFLYLDNNKFSTVPGEFVQTWQSDHIISDATVYGNPLQCDESLSPLVNWVKTPAGRNVVCVVAGRAGDKSKSGNCPVCDSPSRLKGRLIDSLTAGEIGASVSSSDVPFSSRLVNQRPTDNGDSPESSVGFSVIRGGGSNTRRDTGNERTTGRRLPAGTRCSASTCYFFSAVGEKNWDDAQTACKDAGSRLVEISSAAEQRLILALLNEVIREDPTRNSLTRGWWIGAVWDPKTRAFALPSSRRSLPYSNWARGQPNGFADAQDCVEMWDNGQWGDLQCDSHTSNMYICQYYALNN